MCGVCVICTCEGVCAALFLLLTPYSTSKVTLGSEVHLAEVVQLNVSPGMHKVRGGGVTIEGNLPHKVRGGGGHH